MMTVIEYTYPDGSHSYEVLEATPAELDALLDAPDPGAWIAANATVTQTVPVESE